MVELYGYLAATCVMAATTFDRLFVVRLASLLSNVFFIAYALSADLMPVLTLHATLLPLNAIKVLAFFRTDPANTDGRDDETARRKALRLRTRESFQAPTEKAGAKNVMLTEIRNYRAPI